MYRRLHNRLFYAVFYYVFDFFCLRVIESIKSAYKVSCDPADSLEFDAFSDFDIFVFHFAESILCGSILVVMFYE